MGLSKKLKDLTKEYMKDPRGQYFRHLEKILMLSNHYHIPKKDVKEFVDNWFK